MVGSHLVEYLRARDEQVIATYFRPTIRPQEVEKLRPLIELDVRDWRAVEEVVKLNRPQTIYHLAAQSYPTVSWKIPRETIETNIGGTVNLYEAIKETRKRYPSYDPVVVNACSSAGYGATLRLENVPIREDALFQPLHPYGVSKAAQDMLAYQYFVNDQIRGVRARIFNSTGPRKVNDVVSDFCARAADIAVKGGSLRVGNLESRRAILDVGDLVQALVLLSERGICCEAYNICADRAQRVGDIIPILQNASGIAFDVVVDPSLIRPTDELIIFGDTTKIKQHTGWFPTIDLAKTVERVFRYEMTYRSTGSAELGETPDP
jgi:nucleoside-diphosphate-sugar epimerase